MPESLKKLDAFPCGEDVSVTMIGNGCAYAANDGLHGSANRVDLSARTTPHLRLDN